MSSGHSQKSSKNYQNSNIVKRCSGDKIENSENHSDIQKVQSDVQKISDFKNDMNQKDLVQSQRVTKVMSYSGTRLEEITEDPENNSQIVKKGKSDDINDSIQLENNQDQNQNDVLSDCLFEQFMIIGIDKSDLNKYKEQSESKEYENSISCPAKIIHQYPQSEQNLTVPEFVFPFGIRASKINIRGSFSRINELIFKSSKKSICSKFFVLTLRSDNFEKKKDKMNRFLLEKMNPTGQLFIICIMEKDYLEMTNRNKFDFNDRKSRRNRHFYEIKKVYCFLTFYPLFTLFFNLLQDITNHFKIERIQRFSEKFKDDYKILLDLDSDIVEQIFSQQNIKNYLSKLYMMEMNQKSQRVKLVLPLMFSPQKTTLIEINDESYQSQLVDWGASQFLSIVEINNLIRMVVAILLEQKIVLISQQQSLISSAILCLNHIMKPFQWPYPQVYLVPQTLLNTLIEAPLPFIFGINLNISNVIEYLDITQYQDTLFFDLDNSKVHSSKYNLLQLDKSIPQFSNYQKDLERVLVNIQKSRQIVYQPDEDLKIYLNQIFDMFQASFINSIFDYLPVEMHYYQQEDLSSVQSYLEKKVKKQQDKEFMFKFIETQQFNYYIDNLEKSFD